MRRLLLLLVLLSLARPTAAEALYAFEVNSVEFQATVLPDGDVRLRYDIVFTNLPHAEAIDVVDVGMPKPGYSIGSMIGWLDSNALHDIRPSTYVDPGVEVHLGYWAIPPGATRTFSFEASVTDLVFSDTTDDELASFQITPTWFGDQFVTGTTDLKIAVHLPEGVDPERVLHQGVPFQARALFQDHAVATWHFPATRFTGPHKVGLSFPRDVMEPGAVIEMTLWDLFWLWWVGNETVRGVIGVVLAILLLVFFLRFTGMTGWTVIVIALGLGTLFYVTRPGFALAMVFVVPLLCFLMERALRKKRRDYLPPIVSVEGGGIKRGLTAPEAAALLEVPPGKVLTLVVFGLLKKKIISQLRADPLKVEVEGPYKRDPKKRRAAAAKAGVVLHTYEHAFLDAMQEGDGQDLKEISFGPAMKELFQHVADRVSGFDVKETKAYYQYIVSKAWAQAQGLGEIEQRTAAVDRDLEWLLLDPDYDGHFGHWHHHGYHYRPVWARSGGLGDLAGAAASGGGDHVPSVSDITGSFSGWAEGLASDVASAVLPGESGGGGFVDLSGIDRTTGDIFEALAESGGSGGGGGGGGCACAGCACACACAGGGR
ncbi:MAG: hypothetical protein P1V51_04070 [Deltaproteobacteria bacterium]|nr:hypothetical protein [Deltaproteobacteria bacterium]